MKEADIKSNFFFSGYSIQPLFSGWPPPQQPNIKKINEKKTRSICSIMNCRKKYINKRNYRIPISTPYIYKSDKLANIEKNVKSINENKSLKEALEHYTNTVIFQDKKETDIMEQKIKEFNDTTLSLKEKREYDADQDRKEREQIDSDFGKSTRKHKTKKEVKPY